MTDLHQRPTIASRLGSRENNFDFIRLVAALLVLVSHCYPLWGRRFEPWAWLTRHGTLGELAVATFFVISGFLIARSYLMDPNPRRYMAKRCLRIGPGLAVAVLFCIFIVGPLCTTLPLGQYFAESSTWNFLRNIYLFSLKYHLPGVFQNQPDHAVNGSLWTLPNEFALYLVLLGVGMLGLIRRSIVLAIVFAALAVQWHVLPRSPELNNFVFMSVLFGYLVQHTFYFFAGTALLLFADRIRLDGRFAFICLLLIALSSRTPYGPAIFSLALPYLIIWTALTRIPPLRWITRWGDFSYGVYIYAFPVQQTLVYFGKGKGLGFWRFMVLSAIITLVLAALSWYLVERPALRLKRRTPATPLPKPAPEPVLAG